MHYRPHKLRWGSKGIWDPAFMVLKTFRYSASKTQVNIGELQQAQMHPFRICLLLAMNVISVRKKMKILISNSWGKNNLFLSLVFFLAPLSLSLSLSSPPHDVLTFGHWRCYHDSRGEVSIVWTISLSLFNWSDVAWTVEQGFSLANSSGPRLISTTKHK